MKQTVVGRIETVRAGSVSRQTHGRLIVETPGPGFTDLTPAIRRWVGESGIADGLLTVFCRHTSASLTIQENADPDVQHDLLRKLETLVPKHESYYEHGEGNSDSHVKTSLVGNSVTVLVERGKLVLGRWQGVYFCEFDGPRERQMHVKIVSFRPSRD